MHPDMPLILVVEDEQEIASILTGFLNQRGFRTELARDGEEALALFRSAAPDLVLLDLNLPKLDGLDVMRTIRRTSRTPVIMLSARSEEIDQVLGLELGADDYVTKPFRPLEVVARINAVLRRTQGHDREDVRPLRAGSIEIDPRSATATAGGRPLELTGTEFRLLLHLVQNAGRVHSRAELLEHALPDSDALERVVDVHIGNVRRKLAAVEAPDQITTVRGMGFRLDPA